MVDCPDYIQLRVARTCNCVADLSATALDIKERRQIFDLPDPRLEVTEYRLAQCNCPCCGKQVKGVFPEPVTAPVQYGSGVKALIALLSTGYHLCYLSDSFCIFPHPEGPETASPAQWRWPVLRLFVYQDFPIEICSRRCWKKGWAAAPIAGRFYPARNLQL